MKLFKFYIFFILYTVLSVNATNLFSQQSTCLKVKILSKDKSIAFAERGKFVLHFQMQNCGTYNIPLDFYGNIGYPNDSLCNIYFEVLHTVSSGKYVYYNYDSVNYKNVVDSMIWLRSGKIYTFYLPLFQIYGIREPGNYRIQGFYRFIASSGEYYIQKSDYLDVVVK